MTFGLSIAALALALACDAADLTTPEAVCDDPPATDAEEATDLYLAAWSEADRFERACMIERSLAADPVLIAAAPIEGRSAVVEHLGDQVTAFLDEAAGRDVAGAVEFRHDEARLAWVVSDESGTVIERGEDWLEFDERGLLARIHVFAGTGVDAPLPAPLLAWQRAWNAHDEASRVDELTTAATQDVHFTDVLTDIQGRDALAAEIGRQQDGFNAELQLDDHVTVFASMGAQPILIQVRGHIAAPQGSGIRVVDYIRLRDGRVERLAGFPSPAL